MTPNHVRTKVPKALQIVCKSLSDLNDHLTEELTTKPLKNSNLISGRLGRQILSESETKGVPLRQIWSAFLESAKLDQYLRVTKFRLSAGTGFAGALWRYLQERDDNANLKTLESDRRWNALTADLDENNLRRNVQWLADWIEADIAYAAFVAKKVNPKIFGGNPIRNLAALVMTWLRTGKMSERSQKNRWHDELDELGAFYNQDFPDRLEEVTDGLRSADNRPSNPTTSLERWLFRVWPLVIHHEWTKPEIVACIPKEWDREGSFSAILDDFLRRHGLRGGATNGGRGVPSKSTISSEEGSGCRLVNSNVEPSAAGKKSC